MRNLLFLQLQVSQSSSWLLFILAFLTSIGETPSSEVEIPSTEAHYVV